MRWTHFSHSPFTIRTTFLKSTVPMCDWHNLSRHELLCHTHRLTHIQVLVTLSSKQAGYHRCNSPAAHIFTCCLLCGGSLRAMFSNRRQSCSSCSMLSWRRPSWPTPTSNRCRKIKGNRRYGCTPSVATVVETMVAKVASNIEDRVRPYSNALKQYSLLCQVMWLHHGHSVFVPIVNCTLHSIMWLQYWNGRASPAVYIVRNHTRLHIPNTEITWLIAWCNSQSTRNTEKDRTVVCGSYAAASYDDIMSHAISHLRSRG